jgi:hypothetical protein
MRGEIRWDTSLSASDRRHRSERTPVKSFRQRFGVAGYTRSAGAKWTNGVASLPDTLVSWKELIAPGHTSVVRLGGNLVFMKALYSGS